MKINEEKLNCDIISLQKRLNELKFQRKHFEEQGKVIEHRITILKKHEKKV